MALLNAATLVAELGDLERFATAGQLMSYLGLVPSEDTTSDERKQGGITKMGNGIARRALIEAAWHHSVWGLEAVKTGAFAPPALVGPVPFAELQAMIGKAETALEAFIPDEVNGWAGKNLDLEIGPRRLAFTSETFILSFSLPNFHFHAVTAYDILRTRGVPLGKRDYEGRLRTRPA